MLSLKIGLVKIDVQGYEMNVIQGMTNILSGSHNLHPPQIIHYEEQQRIMNIANQVEAKAKSNNSTTTTTSVVHVERGKIQQLLENNYNYTCGHPYGKNDVTCKKL